MMQHCGSKQSFGDEDNFSPPPEEIELHIPDMSALQVKQNKSFIDNTEIHDQKFNLNDLIDGELLHSP